MSSIASCAHSYSLGKNELRPRLTCAFLLAEKMSSIASCAHSCSLREDELRPLDLLILTRCDDDQHYGFMCSFLLVAKISDTRFVE